MANWWDKYPKAEGGGGNWWDKYPKAGDDPTSSVPGPGGPQPGDWRTDYGGREGGILAPKEQELDPMMGAFAVGYGQDPNANLKQSMSTYNVSSGTLPEEIRRKGGFAPDEIAAYQKLLGPEYETQRLPSEAGPLAGRGVFRKRGDVPWQTVSPIGEINAGDITSLAGEALPTAGSMVGAVAGGAVGAPGGAASIATGALGAGAGAFAGEYARLKKGKELGVHGLDDDQIFWHSLTRAGIDAGTALGMGMAYRLYKTFVRRGMPDIPAEEFAARMKTAGEAARQAGLSPENMRPSGIMQGTSQGSDLLAMERMVGKDSPAIRRQLEDKVRASEAEMAGAAQRSGPGLPTETPSAFGARAQGEITGEVSRPMTEAGMESGVARAQAEIAGRGMPRGVSPAEAGEPVEAAFDQGQKMARDTIGKVYKSVRKAGEKEPEIYPTNFSRAAAEEDMRLTGSWVSKLEPEDKALLSSILSRRSKPGEVGFRDEGLGMDNMPETLSSKLGQMSFEQIQNDISLLRRAIRRASAGQGGAERDEIMLRRLERGLEADRKVFFQGNKDALAKLEEADVAWREASDLYDRSFIARTLGSNSRGGALIEPENIVRQIINNPANARAAARVLEKPEFSGQREILRDAFRHEARKAAGIANADIAGDAQIAKTDALNNWIIKHQDSLKHLFSPAEIKAMANPGRLAREAAQRAETLKMAEAEFKGALGEFKIDVGNPANFFERTWATKNPDLAFKMKSIFDRRDPNLSKMYEGFIHQKVMDAAMVKGGDGVTRFAPEKLREFFTKTDGSIEQMAVWLGPQYQRNLQIIEQAVPYMRPQGMPGVAQDTTSLEYTRRARTAVFGVLSKAARVTSYFLKEAEESLSDRVALALYDPVYMEKVLRAGQKTRSGANAAQAFAAGIRDMGQERDAENAGDRMRQNGR